MFISFGRSVSRVLSFKTVIYLSLASLQGFSHLPKRRRADLTSSIRCCSRWGLQHASVAGAWVSSYLAFPPLPKNPAVYFCCTFLKVAFTRDYLAPCPAELGLSSRTGLLLCARDRPIYRNHLQKKSRTQ